MHSALSGFASFLEKVCFRWTISQGRLHRWTCAMVTWTPCPVTMPPSPPAPRQFLDSAVLKFLIILSKTHPPAAVFILPGAPQIMSPVLKSAFLVLRPRFAVVPVPQLREWDWLLGAGDRPCSAPSDPRKARKGFKPGSDGNCMVFDGHGGRMDWKVSTSEPSFAFP